MILHLYTYGNFYAIIRKNNIDRKIASLDIVPDPTQVYPKSTGAAMLCIGWQPVVQPRPGFTYQRGKLWRHKRRKPAGTTKENFGLALSIRRYLAKFFGNGAHLSGVLKYAQSLTQPIYDRLIASWRSRFGAGGTEEGTAILENGIEYQPISLSLNNPA